MFQLRNPQDMHVNMLKCNFQTQVCPWIFRNSYLDGINLNGLSNTYFKRNMLQFTNEPANYSNLNSTIPHVHLLRTDSIKLDTTFLNPKVFLKLNTIHIYQSVHGISEDFFSHFPRLLYIHLDAQYFRKINHGQGIGWIRTRNSRLRIDYNNATHIIENERAFFRIQLRFLFGQKIANIFPNEDFCLYADFPFDQLIYMIFLFQIRHVQQKISFDEIN